MAGNRHSPFATFTKFSPKYYQVIHVYQEKFVSFRLEDGRMFDTVIVKIEFHIFGDPKLDPNSPKM